VEKCSDSCICIFASPSGSSARVALLLTPAQAAFLADHPIPSEDLVISLLSKNGPSGSEFSAQSLKMSNRYEVKYLRSLEVLCAKGKKVEDPYTMPDGTRCVRVDGVEFTDDRVFEEASGKGPLQGDSAHRFLPNPISKEQAKQPSRFVALKLELVALPAAAMADFGIHRAAIIGGVSGCMVAVSITALWGFAMVLMLRFFPSVPPHAATSALKRGASVIVFLLGLCWTAARTYEFYTSFSGASSVAGALGVLAIWGVTTFYSFGLAAWAAVIRR
jgi:hypothetical protein